jgi:hypothetical protein
MRLSHLTTLLLTVGASLLTRPLVVEASATAYWKVEPWGECDKKCPSMRGVMERPISQCFDAVSPCVLASPLVLHVELNVATTDEYLDQVHPEPVPYSRHSA